MGRRAHLKSIRRQIREAFDRATEAQKAALMLAMEQRMGLTPEATLKILAGK